MYSFFQTLRRKGTNKKSEAKDKGASPSGKQTDSSDSSPRKQADSGVISSDKQPDNDARAVENRPESDASSLESQLDRAIEESNLSLIHHLIFEENVLLWNLNQQQQSHVFKLAVISYDTVLVRELLKYNITLSGSESGELLWCAVRGGNGTLARILIHAGVFLDLPDYCNNGCTVLQYLVSSNKHKDIDLAEFMISYGPDIDYTDCKGDNVLMYAMKGKDATACVKLLTEKGAKVDEKVFRRAAKHPDAVILLLSLIAEDYVDTKTKKERAKMAFNQLFWICEDYSFLRELLEIIGAPFGEIDKYGNIFIHAVKYYSDEIVELFLEYGADVNRVPERGEYSESKKSPIHIACEDNAVRKIFMLFGCGANVNVVDSYDNTPFSYLENYGNLGLNEKFAMRFATLQVKGFEVHYCDLVLLEKCNYYAYFQDCLSEVSQMQITKLLDGTFFSVFTMNERKLAVLTLDLCLIDSYSEQQCRELFPIYAADIDLLFIRAKTRRDILLPRVEAFYEALRDLLPDKQINTILKYIWLGNIGRGEYFIAPGL